MQIRDVMNTNIRVVGPDTPVIEAAKQMRDSDFGVMPVCDNDRIVGMITDRDIAVRAVASAKDVRKTSVREAMTPGVLTCFEDDSVDEVTKLMSDRQIRRVPVLNRSNQLVGIVTLADLARANQVSDQAGIAISKISEPRHDEPRPH